MDEAETSTEAAVPDVAPLVSARPRASRFVLPAALVVITTLLALFTVYFNPVRRVVWVDWLYFSSVLIWLGAVRWVSGPVFARGTFKPVDGVLLGAFLVVFAACWIAVLDDWRWAYTGDSLCYPGLAVNWATGRTERSILSAAGGIDNWITFTQSVAYNWPMLLAEPTFFWHRIGKLSVVLTSLATIYAFFQLISGRWVALMVIFLLGGNYYWLWMSHVSYEHSDSQIFAYAGLAVFVSIWRDPTRYTAWALAGVISGVALFFSRIGWGELLAIAVVLSCWTVIRGHWYGLLHYAIGGGVAALPMFLQLPELYKGGMAAVTMNSGETVTFQHALHIAWTIFKWPPWQPSFNAGIHGPIFQRPIAETYLVGSVLAVLAVLPFVGRWLRIPRAAFWILLLFAWDVVLLGMSNRYPTPSQNRVYHVVPLQVFFGCLPFIVLANWVRRWRPAVAVVVLLAVGATVAWSVQNAMILANPHTRVFGQNSYDGSIEAIQRIDKPIVVFTKREYFAESMQNPKEMVNVIYGLHEHVAISNDYTETGVREACDYARVICYELFPEHRQAMEAVLVNIPHEKIHMLNTDELQCVYCRIGKGAGEAPPVN